MTSSSLPNDGASRRRDVAEQGYNRELLKAMTQEMHAEDLRRLANAALSLAVELEAEERGVPSSQLPRSDGRVIAAFPATGKSWLAMQHTCIEDSDSSAFSRGPEWPQSYIDRIRHLKGLGATVFASTHAEVRAALADAGIPFTLVYPEVSLREEYRARMERRGSPPVLIRKVIDELWDDALADCAAQTGCDHVVLGSGQYLADVIACSTSSEEADRA